MKAISDMTIGEFAAFVATKLLEKGIDVTLSGGSCVSIYTNNKWHSNDLDFISNGAIAHRIMTKTLLDIGFETKGRYVKHSESQYYVEFPTGPLMAGNEFIKNNSTLIYDTGNLKILTPTDCVKDRLSQYFYWKDQQSLDQAVSVAKDNVVDIKNIEMWAKKEGMQDEFNKIKNVIESKSAASKPLVSKRRR